MLMVLLASLENEDQQRILTSFYLAYNDRLFRYALSISGGAALAEEVLSAAWIKCVEQIETFLSVPTEKRIYWMTVVVKNTALTMKKREGRHDSMDPTAWDPIASDDQDPQHAQDHLDIVKTIRSMPEQYRTILELRFLQEWNSQQIADSMGLTVAAVNTRISRGRKLLQKKLIEEGYHL